MRQKKERNRWIRLIKIIRTYMGIPMMFNEATIRTGAVGSITGCHKGFWSRFDNRKELLLCFAMSREQRFEQLMVSGRFPSFLSFF